MPLKSRANTSTKNKPLIIIAHSARALAESASRANYSVIAVDGFTDVDTLRVCIEAWCIPLIDAKFPRHKLHTCLKKLNTRYPRAKVLLGAGAEAYAQVVESFADWQLLGNSSSCIDQIYNPSKFFKGLDELAIPYPQTRWQRPEKDDFTWLRKATYGCGGMGVRRAKVAPLQSTASVYWQQELEGIPISALCFSDKNKWHVIGINRQFTQALTDDLPYVYAGALANAEIDESSKDKLISYVDKIINHFKIIGLTSIDLLLTADELYVLEVNPRVSASYELYERMLEGVNLIDEHIRVCEGERLLQWQPIKSQSICSIVYAKSDFQVRERVNWPSWAHDLPEAGRRICQYEPVCSVYAMADEADDLEQLVLARAHEAQTLLKQ